MPRPGTPQLVSLGQDAVASILADVIPEPVGAAVALLFAAQNYDAARFCGQGDVGDPGMSAQDWSDALDYTNPIVNLPARTKAQQWFQHVIFPVLCECSDGTAPPPPVVTGPPPTGGPAGVPNSQIGSHCFENKQTRLANYANQQSWNFNDILPQVGAGAHNDGEFTSQNVQTPLPSGIVVNGSVGSEGANAETVQFLVNCYNAAGTSLTSPWESNFVAPGGSVVSPLFTFPANTASWQLIAFGGSGTASTNTVTAEVIIYCQGQSPTGVSSPCCPPDPMVQGQLGAIYEMLTQLLSLQALQGAYQDTIRHSGLSGNGTIAINPASSAIRVEVRTDLTSWPQNVQTPTYFYSLGFVTPFAVGTPLRGQRLIYDRQTFTWPSYTDTIGYSFSPGITCDLVELTRGA